MSFDRSESRNTQPGTRWFSARAVMMVAIASHTVLTIDLGPSGDIGSQTLGSPFPLILLISR
jgi:hypothetical protein